MKIQTFLCIAALLLVGWVKQTDSEGVTQKNNISSLPSWNDGPTKQAIINFVKKTTTEGSPDFIPIADRIACFDNDGTLWSEQPIYFQMAFALDQIKVKAPQHPEWKNQEPYKSVLEGNIKEVVSSEASLKKILMASHSGMSTDEFNSDVKRWIQSAKHPKSGKLYKEMVYQPMLELIQYLQKNNYQTYIVSGGGVDFMRAWATDVYGIPSNQIIGSSGKLKYEVQINGKTELIKLPEVNFIDDKEGKPEAIHQYIGKRPILSFGNSDGDYQMLQWTTTADGYPRLAAIVHHTDGEREFAYDRDSSIGKLNKGLDDAVKNGWFLIDMKKDWKVIYPKK